MHLKLLKLEKKSKKPKISNLNTKKMPEKIP